MYKLIGTAFLLEGLHIRRSFCLEGVSSMERLLDNQMWPLVMIVAANLVYHMASKNLPEDLNPFAGLMVTYGVALLVSFVLFSLTSSGTTFQAAASHINVLSVLMGLAVVGIEGSYIMAYRMGWLVSRASLIANASTAICLLLLGAVWFQEGFSLRTVLGMLCCILGTVIMQTG
jgi:drug/metabolite transporter (DMT)-like permease